MKHLFIVNPAAGGSNKTNTEAAIQKIQNFAEDIKEPVEIYYTTGPMDACRKIAEDADALQDRNKISLYVYAYGGDGTLNECVNGAALRSNVAITSYPRGTGNDFLKTFSAVNIDKFRDLHALARGEVKKLDLIECAAEEQTRFGINICSVGIDARVGTDVHKYTKIPIIGGSMGYNISLLVNVIKGITRHYRIKVGEKIFDGKYTLACVCNGRYYGGGFNPVPDALPDDGILDCLVVEPVSRFQVAQIVGKYSKGRFAEFPDVFHYERTTKMEIDSNHSFIVNVDGEALHTNKITFNLIPKGINFLFPV